MKPQSAVDEQATTKTGEIELEDEELEEVIAPGIKLNHNEMLITAEVELEVDELEEAILPGRSLNHNETLIRDAGEVELDVEELEEVICVDYRHPFNVT
jgi:hypothetical protein